MSLIYKIDVLQALKNKGYNTNVLRKKRLLSESTIQKLRNKQSIGWDNLNTICNLLQCQPGDILEYEENSED